MAATLGIIIGGVVVAFVLIGGLTWYCRRRNSGKRNTLVLKVDEPTDAEIAREAISRKVTTSTTSSNSRGEGSSSSHGTLHTINVVSPISTRSPPAVAQPDTRRSMNLPSNPRQSLPNNNAYGRYQPPPGLQQPPVPAVPTIVTSGPVDEGRAYISRPITLLPPVPQVLPAGRPPQMSQANLPGNPRHYMLQSGTVGRQAQQGNDAGYARNNGTRYGHNRRETLRDETVVSAFGLLGPDGNATVLSESPQSIGSGAPLRLTETTMPSGRR
ncbi:hypothetical protein FS837_003775 [Tulasnella sp. UAMH 9824]|nr:hypothetical protein FS837_003775 [Tulasnella sp. UAMH 9824]